MLLERDGQIGQLLDAIRRLKAGPGQVVLLSGEAGTGKTSLVRQVRSEVSAQFDGKLRWAEGWCEALFTPRPFGPLHDMPEVIDPHVLGQLKDGGDRAGVFAAIRDQLANSALPHVIVWEDVHWADHATYDLLKYLGRRIALLRTVLIVTFRDDEVLDDHPLKTVIGDLPPDSLTRITLGPLSREAVGALAEESGVPAEGIFDATGGNPFLVQEVLASRSAQSTDVPASVRDAVAARQLRLPPELRQLLEDMSAIPGPVPVWLVKALAGPDAERLIQQALSRNLLKQTENFSLLFRHELARLATFERIAPPLRRDLHGRILEALKAHEGEPALDEMVHHAHAARAIRDVLLFAPAAARRAALNGAHREAAAHLATALRFVDDAEPELAAELYEMWAYESGLAERIDDEVLEARRHAVTLWRALGRTEKVGENLRALSRLHWYRGEAADATRFSDMAIEALESTPPSIARGMAYSVRSQLHMLHDEMDMAIHWGNEALKIEAQFPNPELRAHALNNIGTAMLFRGDEDGTAHMLESLEIARENGLHEHAARVYTNLSEYAVDFRKFSLAEKTLAEGLAYDSEHDLFAWTYYLAGRQALLRLDQGRIKDAERIARGIWERDRLTLLMKLPALQVLAKARLRLGSSDAKTWLDRAFVDSLATEELQNIVPARLMLVEAAWLWDQPDLAQESLDQFQNMRAGDRHPWDAGECSVWLHRFGRAPPQLDVEALPEPFRLEIRGEIVSAAEAWKTLGLPDKAGITLLMSDRFEDLAAAALLFQQTGFTAAIEKVKQKARALGLENPVRKPRRKGAYAASRSHPLGLTGREQQILRLVYDGLTNAQIAEQFSRSERTIEHHVSALLSKMNVTSRMAAVLRVQNERWLIAEEGT